MTLSFYHLLFLFFSPIFKAQRLKTFKKPLQSFVCKMSSDIPTYTFQCFSLYKRCRTLLAPNALQLFQRRSGTSERTLCIFSQDVAERPIALKVLIKMNKLADAKKYFEKALEIKQKTSNNVATDRDVAFTLNEIGRCLTKMNKLTDAKECLEKALKIKQLSNDINTNRDKAFTLNDIGQCLIKMNKFTDAKEYLEKSLKIQQQLPNDIASDRDIAFTLNHIGRCLIEMNEVTDAKEYLEKH